MNSFTLSLAEAIKRETEEAETVSAFASLSVLPDQKSTEAKQSEQEAEK
jgi:hypothetical protein